MISRHEQEMSKRIVYGKSLFQQGYAPGSSGNISVRRKDGILITPTNSCLGCLDPSRITKLDFNGKLISGDKLRFIITQHDLPCEYRQSLSSMG